MADETFVRELQAVLKNHNIDHNYHLPLGTSGELKTCVLLSMGFRESLLGMQLTALTDDALEKHIQSLKGSLRKVQDTLKHPDFSQSDPDMIMTHRKLSQPLRDKVNDWIVALDKVMLDRQVRASLPQPDSQSPVEASSYPHPAHVQPGNPGPQSRLPTSPGASRGTVPAHPVADQSSRHLNHSTADSAAHSAGLKR
jgi:hypothetical protein